MGVVLVSACGAPGQSSEPPAEPARAPAASESELVGVLRASDDGYAREAASLIADAVSAARGEASSAAVEHCGADARGHVDAIERFVTRTPAAAREAIPAVTLARLRLEACIARRCDVVNDGHTEVRAVWWLKGDAEQLWEAMSAGGSDDPFLRGVVAELREDWTAAVAAYGDAVGARASCAPAQAEALLRLAEAQAKLRDTAGQEASLVRALSLVESAGALWLAGSVHLELGYRHAVARNYEAALPSYKASSRAYAALGPLGAIFEADARNARAVALDALGRYDDAIHENEAVARIRAQVLGSVHALTLISFSNIAVVLSRVGRADEALAVNLSVLEKRERVLRPDDPSLAVSMDSNASALVTAGRHAEAIALCERSIRVREAAGSRGRTDLPRSHVCLANALGRAGRNQEALRSIATALELAREGGTPGPDVADFLTVRAWIAEQAGDADLATASREEAARLREQHAGSLVP